ncbi:hypothetical protein [Methylobacterium sp. CCH5-D2]|uniref:hypothetical protein n=1 Tax=Methylobacterium sp. CCH5-D2 TaxID=1768765 RepID=UPI000ACD7588|nr:hypothetical protein [Methylobacterium sp. CCH5-D2]
MKFVRASDHSLAAGRDIIVKIDGSDPALIRTIIEQVLAEQSGRPAARIRFHNSNNLKIEDMGEFTSRVSAFNFVQSDENRSKFREYATGYLQKSKNAETVGRLFNGVDQALRKKEFKRAHKLLGRLLNVAGLTDERDDIIENYLLSGYISNANSGDTKGMLALIEEAHQNFFSSINEGIAYLLIEVQQEIATRQNNDNLLLENERLLLDFLSKNSIPSDSSGLLGLLYRRMGERGSITYLQKAEDIFRSILRTRTALTAEEANNFGIALIRDFELTRNPEKLDEALSVLNGIDFKRDDYPLVDYLSLPKAMNNIGNAYKQKLTFTGQPEFYVHAIENYTRAEAYWSEASAPYEWAMIQKNKAETRVAYYDITGHADVLPVADDEVSASLKCRTEASSPFQYQKSMDVKQKIEQALQKADPSHKHSR